MSSLVRLTYHVFISLSVCYFPVSFFLIFTPLSKQSSVSVDPGADETAIWLRATEREVLLAWGLCCCHGTDAW